MLSVIEKIHQEKSQVEVRYYLRGEVHVTNLWGYVNVFAETTNFNGETVFVWQWRDGDLWKVSENDETCLGSDPSGLIWWSRMHNSCFGPSEFLSSEKLLEWLRLARPDAYSDYLEATEGLSKDQAEAIRVEKIAAIYAAMIAPEKNESFKDTGLRLKAAIKGHIEKAVFHRAIQMVREKAH